MKKIYLILIVCIMTVCITKVHSQTINLNATNNGTTKQVCNGTFYDDKTNGNYAANVDYNVTLCPSTPNKRIKLEFETFDIDESDQFYIYYGTSMTDNSIVFNYETGNNYFTKDELLGKDVSTPITEPSGCLTFRLVSDAYKVAAGWKAKISCENICQDFNIGIDTVFTKYDSLGNQSTRPVRYLFDVVWRDVTQSVGSGTVSGVDNWDSTAYLEDGKQHFFVRDTVRYHAVDICVGDSIVLKAAPDFIYNDNAYHQTPQTCVYYWVFGDDIADTIQYNPVVSHKYESVMGYNLGLAIYDTSNNGCWGKLNDFSVRVRIAPNPIKTVANLNDMCSGDRQMITVGYGANSTIVTEPIEFNQTAHEEFNTRTFIPDGGNASAGSQCYTSPVTFTTFTPGATVTSAEEVQDICLNMEHSYIGDIGIYLTCPNGQYVVLKYVNHDMMGFLGAPNNVGGSAGAWSDSGDDYYNVQDSNANPPGLGFTYCFSNIYLDDAMGVLSHPGSGQYANKTITSFTNTDPTIGPVGTSTISTIDSTDYNGKKQFFQTPVQNLITGPNLTQQITSGSTNYAASKTPDVTGFEELVGCPLNGEWVISVCDVWVSDNGWIFSWWMDIGKSSSSDWDYQVPLDTVLWDGPYYTPLSNTSAVIEPPIDINGSFIYKIHITDDFGCVWDTITHLNVVQTPIVDLGPDTSSCESIGITLDAGNAGALRYDWEPTGENTKTIFANPGENVTGLQQYAVMVTQYNGNIYCYGNDTINIEIYPSAKAAFTTDKYPLEGCEPFSFQLLNASSEATKYEWSVGEETTTEESPSFTFPFGQYDLTLKVTSEHGCTDEISYNNIINVFRSPAADFGWNPSVPYASEPYVSMVNLTTPEDPNNQFRWEFQVNKNDPSGIENIFGYEPTYYWQAPSGESLAGDYIVTLDAYSHNLAPSGNVYECHDTITKTITIINDNLIFPTVITPNGDGINDIFEIRNLIDGQAFPDNELAIYNRYGKRIFFVQDIRKPNQFWDPETTNSPTGTYFYRFIGRGPIRNVEFTGSIEIIRD